MIQIRGGKSALYGEQKRQLRGGKCVKLRGGANVPRANELLPIDDGENDDEVDDDHDEEDHDKYG